MVTKGSTKILSVTANSHPIPVIKDKNGKLIKDKVNDITFIYKDKDGIPFTKYTYEDWLSSLFDCYQRVLLDKIFIKETNNVIQGNTVRICKDLERLKHLCCHMQRWLGCDDEAIKELCQEVNKENKNGVI